MCDLGDLKRYETHFKKQYIGEINVNVSKGYKLVGAELWQTQSVLVYFDRAD